MTMALSLLSGNPNGIDSCIFSSILMLKLVIESHRLAQPFQNSLLLLQSIRKCDIVSILLQYDHMSSVFILMFFNHSLQVNGLLMVMLSPSVKTSITRVSEVL